MKIQANTEVLLTRVSSPNAQVRPSNGRRITIPSSRDLVKYHYRTSILMLLSSVASNRKKLCGISSTCRASLHVLKINTVRTRKMCLNILSRDF